MYIRHGQIVQLNIWIVRHTHRGRVRPVIGSLETSVPNNAKQTSATRRFVFHPFSFCFRSAHSGSLFSTVLSALNNFSKGSLELQVQIRRELLPDVTVSSKFMPQQHIIFNLLAIQLREPLASKLSRVFIPTILNSDVHFSPFLFIGQGS